MSWLSFIIKHVKWKRRTPAIIEERPANSTVARLTTTSFNYEKYCNCRLKELYCRHRIVCKIKSDTVDWTICYNNSVSLSKRVCIYYPFILGHIVTLYEAKKLRIQNIENEIKRLLSNINEDLRSENICAAHSKFENCVELLKRISNAQLEQELRGLDMRIDNKKHEVENRVNAGLEDLRMQIEVANLAQLKQLLQKVNNIETGDIASLSKDKEEVHKVINNKIKRLTYEKKKTEEYNKIENLNREILNSNISDANKIYESIDKDFVNKDVGLKESFGELETIYYALSSSNTTVISRNTGSGMSITDRPKNICPDCQTEMILIESKVDTGQKIKGAAVGAFLGVLALPVMGILGPIIGGVVGEHEVKDNKYYKCPTCGHTHST